MSASLIADESVDYRIVGRLRGLGLRLISILEQAPGLSDSVVLQTAVDNGAILLTEDKDFGELVFSRRKTETSVILLRYPAGEWERMIDPLLHMVKVEMRDDPHCFIVITPRKTRRRDL